MKKSITRRLMTALLAAVMCVSMAACGSKTDDTRRTAPAMPTAPRSIPSACAKWWRST